MGDVPTLSNEDRARILDTESVGGALFELAELYDVPLTNNEPRLQKCDLGEHALLPVGDFISDVEMVFRHFGWTPPNRTP